MQHAVIIPDTNVIVSASIMQHLDDIGSIKHMFYDESIQMFSLFVTRSDIRGVLVPTVARECFKVLMKSVRGTLVSRKWHGIPATKMYKITIEIVTSSEIKMSKLMSRLNSVDIDDADLSNNLQRVCNMSKVLKNIYETTYAKHTWRDREATNRTKLIGSEPKWLKAQKREVFNAHRTQIITEARQLKRFVAGYPHKSDQEILAQAATYKDSLPSNKAWILIASLDTGFFSPHRRRGTTSDIVTKRIFLEFKIKCDLPRRIFELASGN